MSIGSAIGPSIVRAIGSALAGGGAAWSPLDRADLVAWYDIQDLSTMWQDSAGTTPAVVGQPVGKILDRSPNARHATQATAGARPTLLQAVSGKYYLDFNGVGTNIDSAPFAFGSDKLTVVSGTHTDAAGGAIVSFGAVAADTQTFEWGYLSSGLLLYLRGSGSFGARGTSSVGTSAVVGSAVANLTGNSQATENPYLRVDGVQPALTNYGAADSGSGNFGTNALVMGSGTARFNGGIYQLLVFSDVSTVAQLEEAESFVAGRCGVTLPFEYVPTAFNDTGAEVQQSGYVQTSPFAHADYTTSAETIWVAGYSTIQPSFPTYAEIGVFVDGVHNQSVLAPASGAFASRITLPAGSKTLSFVNGLQSSPTQSLSAVVGTFVTSIWSSVPMTEVAASSANRIVVYGDSICVGANATSPVEEGWVQLVRAAHSPDSLAVEGFGFRSLYLDASDSTARAIFVAKMAAYNPTTIWLAIGTNDYGLNKWTAASFGTAYAAILDGLHAAIPGASIYCQTPIVRTTETANAFGSTLDDYRAQIATAVSTRTAYATLVDGTAILTTGDLADGVHPTTAGHALYAAAVIAELGL